MPQENVALIAFNRGLVSPLALCRIDLKRTAMSSEISTNWMSRVLGSSMLRPGTGYISGVRSNLKSIHIPFIFSSLDKALLEFTDNVMRVKIAGVPINYSNTVTTTVTSGNFSSATGWTDTDQAGAVSTISLGTLKLVGTGFNSAIREQNVTISAGNQNKEHCLRIGVFRGPIVFSVGSTSAGDDYITRTTLGTGVHYLTFTPTGGNAYIRLSSSAKSNKIVDYCEVFTGDLEIATEYDDDDLQSMRWDQSADVVYIACRGGVPQYKVERRSTRSWSMVRYLPSDGPFRIQNTSTVRITPSAISGDITLTASAPMFKSTNVDSLYRLDSIGQFVSLAVSGDNQWSNPIRVSGVGTSRVTRYTITGTWSGTVRLQQSVGEPGNWVNFGGALTANVNTTFDDNLDNQIIYYRIGIDVGEYTSGTANVSLTQNNGSISGIVRITGFTDQQTVDAEVLEDLGGTDAVLDWAEGEWSERRGTPSTVALHEGRLFWSGKSKIWGSVSDAYESFDDETDGDSAPISRSIGSGPVDSVNFLLPLQRLILGTDGAEWPARSSSFDEPLTASNFNLKSPSTQGSANVPAVKIDDRGLFVQKSGTKLYQLQYGSDSSGLGYDYTSTNLCELVPEIGEPSFTRIAVQRQPDTRVHCVRSDGRVAILVSEPAEEVMCWLMFETDGMVEDAFVLPGLIEDEVYYTVRRLVNGSTVRYLEKWAMEREARGGTLNKQADSFVIYNGASTTTITGLSHLEGCSVVAWGDGTNRGTYTVSGGQITLDRAVRECVVGLYYAAPYLSAKLAYAAGGGTALTRRKRVDHLGLVLQDTHPQGLKYGGSLLAKTNNFKYSDQLDNAIWTKTRTTVTANAVSSPVDSATTADKLVETTANNTHLMSQLVNLRQTDYTCMSVYAKAAGTNYIKLSVSGDAGTFSAFFNLSTGIVELTSLDNDTNATGIRARIEDVGSGWYRCYISGVADTTGGYGVTGTVNLASSASTISYAGNVANGVYMIGLQIEPGKKPSDRKQTTAQPAKEYVHLDDLPKYEDGALVDQDEIWEQYDKPGVEFNGEWNTDSRMALLAEAPKPCTILAAVLEMKTNG